MAIFNSYVKLPEGILFGVCNLPTPYFKGSMFSEVVPALADAINDTKTHEFAEFPTDLATWKRPWNPYNAALENVCLAAMSGPQLCLLVY